MKNNLLKMGICVLVILCFTLPISADKNLSQSDKVNGMMSGESLMVPDLVYYPASHDFGYVFEGETYQTTFEIWNGGTGTLTWNLGIVHTWISPFPTSGSSTGEHDAVTVTIDTTGLAPGGYSGFVSISANDGGGLRYFNVYCEVNSRQNIPSKPSGPTTGTAGSSYEYRTNAIDSDGDEVQVRFDWDGSYSSWSPLAASGTTFITTHAWSTPGTYQVKAQAKDEHGASSRWSSALTVVISGGGSNNPPNTPSVPSGPTSGSPGTSYAYDASATDPDGDQVKYYFDWDDGSGDWTGLVASGSSALLSHVWAAADTYEVRVKAQDEHGAESGWSTVLTVIISDNAAPNKPDKPSGPTTGTIGISYTYTASAIDPNGDQVYLMFDWADGTDSGWLGPYNSGDPVSSLHIWSAQGSYAVKVKAKDTSDVESEWSDPLAISMPLRHQILLERIIEWILQLFGVTIP